jgi:hypothetical protein
MIIEDTQWLATSSSSSHAAFEIHLPHLIRTLLLKSLQSWLRAVFLNQQTISLYDSIYGYPGNLNTLPSEQYL